MNSVNHLTILLKEKLNELCEIYHKGEPPENRRDTQFFSYVKEETAPIFSLLDEWEQACLNAFENKSINVFPGQIQSTKENMELVIMHSYYIDIRKKRYMSYIQSIEYVFDQIRNKRDKHMRGKTNGKQ
ncbi:MAG TPA: DUF1798 family protein [Cerasibacillus sp.]|uniref:DUF1798 family protein n=1 Tax=Cerasibacillus sp. TaxID=2498711 RepID=UPI002F42BD47